MATCSGLASESCEPQERKEVMVKCKGDTCSYHSTWCTTTQQLEDRNLKEEAMSCKPASSVSEENRNLKRAGWGVCSWVWPVRDSSSM